MNIKLSFALLPVLIVLIVTACAPAITDGAAPIVIAVPPAEDETSAIVPLTGGSEAETAREAQAPRLWSGEVFLSDKDTPDVSIIANQDLQNVCISEDSLTRRHGSGRELSAAAKSLCLRCDLC
jgi:hypothetical protein